MYLVVGVPGSGKSWVTSQLREGYEVVPHDDHIGNHYGKVLEQKYKVGERNILGELPFSISETKEYLEGKKVPLDIVFILEKEPVLKRRYWERDGKEIPQGHLTRQKTYTQRALQYKSVSGSSDKILNYLKTLLMN